MDRRGRVCGCLAGADEIARRTGKADHHEPEEPLFHVHPRGKTSTDYTYATRCSVQYSARRDFKNIIGSEGMCASCRPRKRTMIEYRPTQAADSLQASSTGNNG